MHTARGRSLTHQSKSHTTNSKYVYTTVFPASKEAKHKAPCTIFSLRTSNQPTPRYKSILQEEKKKALGLFYIKPNRTTGTRHIKQWYTRAWIVVGEHHRRRGLELRCDQPRQAAPRP